jgi:hypothetical protein
LICAVDRSLTSRVALSVNDAIMAYPRQEGFDYESLVCGP